MSANPRTLEYINRGVKTLVERGAFHNGVEFRPTQGDAIYAYHDFLGREDLTPEQKLKGFFEIPTGVGKTAMFLAVLDEAHKIARAEGDKLRAMIVVPTISILEQMEKEVKDWAPDFLETMGFFGGKSRNMGDDLTIITYDSWVTKMEAGEVDSSNVDILISDEAHRGTSERRLTNMFNAFANGTLQLAFTATARFDDEKSVEQSHGHQIFSRGVAESIRLGELAAYIQAQLYVIRVQPLPDQDVFEDGEEKDQAYESALRIGMKQEAWMQQMVAVWRDGRDEHTGDPLTDNKSGFYVFGTDMADRFVELASADPVLQQRAASQGCKQVIEALHSKMSPGRQREIMEAYKRGEILGLVSDQQLKEGFNYPAMKNVFDYPRSSLVDKAQIIGRAARQWWNPVKERNEGATIVDSIVYVGSDDPDEDERLKNAAIRNAIMAWSVLEGTAVFADKEDFGSRFSDEPRSHSAGGVKPVLGLDITSYLSFEDLQAIYAEQQNLQGKNRIEITDEMRNELKSEMQRCGMGAISLINAARTALGTLTHQKITSWINIESGTKAVDQTEWDRVMAVAKALPDASIKEWIPLTDEMRAELKSEMCRTGKGGVAIFNTLLGQPDGLTGSKIASWADKKSTLRNVNKVEWNFVMAAVKVLPDKIIKESIDLTDSMRTELRNEMGRAGVGSIALHKSLQLGPETLDEAKIKRWIDAKSGMKTVNKVEWDFVMAAAKALPDTVAKESIYLTDDMRIELKNEMGRINRGVRTFLSTLAEKPESLTEKKMGSWLDPKSTTKNVDKVLWEFVMNAVKALPGRQKGRPKPPGMG